MVIDASVAFKWVFIEEDSALAAALIGREDLVSPALLLAEVGNALWKKGRRGELVDQQAYPIQLALVASLLTIVADEAVIGRALTIAVELDHPIYDCVYLALAEQLDTTLVTADAKFLRKANAVGYDRVARLA